MKYKFAPALFPALAFSVLLLYAVNSDFSVQFHKNTEYILNDNLETAPLEFKPIVDSVYVLGKSFIEISLSEQLVYLHVRGDSTKSMRISSGNSRINKGKDTPTGLFSVQSKSRLTTSKQFNNAKLYNWIGFNYNIGFHGLEGNSYYRTLGKSPSSHGCVRISREDGDTLYKYVNIGTPVLVFDEVPARRLTFADYYHFRDGKDLIISSASKSATKILKQRLESLYKGEYYIQTRGKLFMDSKTALRPGGYDIGFYQKIPFRQSRPIDLPSEPVVKADNLQIPIFISVTELQSVALDLISSKLIANQ
ncbi:MAG: L,D-transpeptidase [Candidatus Kapabacteria bacterium]|nr:L,D-transpeptidase [Candidatus Kapabacteria bacterium]